MKKCKCLKCGGIYDLPQPKSCPACGGVKFQSYFTKDPVPPKASPAVPRTAPKTAPAASPRPAPQSSRTMATGKPPGRRFRGLQSAFSGMTRKDWLKWITRPVSVLVTTAVFSLVYMIPAVILGGWWWGVFGIVAVCAIVKFMFLRCG